MSAPHKGVLRDPGRKEIEGGCRRDGPRRQCVYAFGRTFAVLLDPSTPHVPKPDPLGQTGFLYEDRNGHSFRYIKYVFVDNAGWRYFLWLRASVKVDYVNLIKRTHQGSA